MVCKGPRYALYYLRTALLIINLGPLIIEGNDSTQTIFNSTHYSLSTSRHPNMIMSERGMGEIN